MGEAANWISRVVHEMPPLVRATWATAALVVVVVLAVLLYAERRLYARMGRQKECLAVRMPCLPIVGAAVAAVIFSNPVKSGMESLAWFYILALTLGPLLYFGLHVLVARAFGLSAREGFALAATGLLIVILPAIVAVPTQSAGFRAQWFWNAREAALAPTSAPGHTLVQAQRLTLPGGEEIWTQHWRAGREVRQVESVEIPPYGAGGSSPTQRFTSFGSWVCRDREDLHVTWPAVMKEAALTVRWRDGDGSLRRSELRVALPPGETVPLKAEWSADGVALNARPPRIAVFTALLTPHGEPDYTSLTMWAPHETPRDFCLPQPYRTERPLAGIMLRLDRPKAEPLRPEFPAFR